MGAVSWLERLSRQHEVIARERIETRIVRIGRAYDNDIVLDDPHVAAHHLHVTRDVDGVWYAEDLGSLNGLRAAGSRLRVERLALRDGAIVQVGQTLLRMRDASDAVAAELPLMHPRPYWLYGIVAVVAACGLALLSQWLGETAEPKLIRYLSPLLALIAMIVLWVTGWAVFSRIFTGLARFGLHLAIAGTALLVVTLWDLAVTYGAFAFSATVLTGTVRAVAWAAFTLACYLHLRAFGRSGRPIKAGVALALGLLGFVTQSLNVAERRSEQGSAPVLERLAPPSLRLAPLEPREAFLDRAAGLRATLDEAREKQPVGGDDEASDPTE